MSILCLVSVIHMRWAVIMVYLWGGKIKSFIRRNFSFACILPLSRSLSTHIFTLHIPCIVWVCQLSNNSTIITVFNQLIPCCTNSIGVGTVTGASILYCIYPITSIGQTWQYFRTKTRNSFVHCAKPQNHVDIPYQLEHQLYLMSAMVSKWCAFWANCTWKWCGPCVHQLNGNHNFTRFSQDGVHN